jgi:hypothetical protein
MADDFQYDVFLSHSAKDKAVVRGVAESARGGRPDGSRRGLMSGKSRPRFPAPIGWERGQG